jgi:DNA-binding GntR family transcriptional regulator
VRVIRRRHGTTGGEGPRGTKRLTRADIAYERIKAKIVRCEFEPGVRFTEAALAAELRTTKMPVREALSRLVQEGLVRSIPRKGYEVDPVTVRDTRELFELRLAVEPLAVELAAQRIDERTLARLAELCMVKCDPRDRASVRAFAQSHREFHLLITRACGNHRLSDVVEHVLEEADRLVYMGLLRLDRDASLGAGHGELLKALELRDGAAARRIAAETVIKTRDELLSEAFNSPAVQLAALQPRALVTTARG